MVTQRADEDKVGIMAEPLREVKLKVGDHILMDGNSGYLLEKLPKSEVEDLTLEEVPEGKANITTGGAVAPPVGPGHAP